jgi:mannosylfructose-phosphate synthase
VSSPDPNRRDTEPALRADSGLPRVAMILPHGYATAGACSAVRAPDAHAVYVSELSRRLVRLGYEVDVWTRQLDDEPTIEVLEDHLRIVRIRCGKNETIGEEELSLNLRAWREDALQMIERTGISYSFVSSHYWLGGAAGNYLGAALRIPHVHTPHSLGTWKQRELLAGSSCDTADFEAKCKVDTRTRTEHRIYRHASLIVATTPVQTDMLKLDYGVASEKLRVIPAGYDDSRFFPVDDDARDALRSRLGYQGRAVVSFGRPCEADGYDLLIQAFAEVVARDTAASLHLVVDRDARNDAVHVVQNCRELTLALGLDRHVRFVESNSAELADHFRAADVFVLASRYDPLGIAAIEAMACGTPAVVTIHGGLFRMLRFGVDGLFADPFEPADLGMTILKAFRHPRLAERLARNGAHTARNYFTWDSVARQLIAAVQDRPSVGLAPNELEPPIDRCGSDDQTPTDAPGYRSY